MVRWEQQPKEEYVVLNPIQFEEKVGTVEGIVWVDQEVETKRDESVLGMKRSQQ